MSGRVSRRYSRGGKKPPKKGTGAMNCPFASERDERHGRIAGRC
jgi:hypothetical protein